MVATIDSGRLWERIETLGRITDPDRPYTRRSFTQLHADGRDWLRERFAEAGLSIRLDAAANMAGLRPGTQPGLAPILIGSHSDSVPDGGRFDGMAGVLSALEVAQTLADKGIELRHPLEVIDFLAEEPSVFGMSCVGSRLMGGRIGREHLGVTSPDGETLADAIRRMGGDPDRLAEAVRGPGSIAAYAEVHIEQGPVLEATPGSVGIVTAIVGITRFAVTFEGRADHAGNTPMDRRCDALAAAARFVVHVEEAARDLNSGDPYFVATVGQLNVLPNATNVVPGRVDLGIEFRSDSDAARESFERDILAFLDALGSRGDLRVSATKVSDAAPAICSDIVQGAIRNACGKLGRTAIELPSGAGHDSMHLVDAGPIGMIFIPCREGRSHCPEEWVEPADLAAGAEVLYEAVLELDARLD